MKTIKGLEAFSVLMLTAIALPVAAEEEDSEITALTTPESSIDVGFGYVVNDNYHFGQYRGLTDAGAYGLLNLDFVNRNDSTGTWLSFDAQNLALDTRSVTFEHERQGNWNYFVDYAQIPRENPFTHNTRLSGIGTNDLAVNLISPRDVRLRTERERLTLGGSKWLGDSFNISVKARDEAKDGTRQFGRGTGGAMEFLAEPIDQHIRQIEATMTYAGRKLNLSGGYYGTEFDNEDTALFIAGGAPELATFTPIALPPDNQSHQVYLAGNYQFASTVNSTFKASYAKATQDDDFIVPAAPAVGRTDLGGRIDTTQLQLGINARPTSKLTLLANLRYEDRDDKTPVEDYFVVTSTSTATGENEPRSIETIFGKLEASYYLPAGFRMTAGFDDEKKTRNTSTVRAVSFREETDEQSYRFELRRSISETITGELAYVHSDRDGSEPLTNTVTNGTLGSNLILPIHLADRKRDKARLLLDWTPVEKASLQFSADYSDDEYDAGRNADDLGVREGRMEFYSLDAYFQFTANLSMTVWGSTSDNTMEQAACVGAATPAGCAHTTTNPNWLAQLGNSEDAAGLGLEGKVGEKIKLGIDAQYSEILDEFGQTTLTAGATAPVVPDIHTRITTASAYGLYNLNDKASIRLDMIYDLYETDDWTWATFNYRDGTDVFNDPHDETFYVGVSYTYRWH